MTMTLGRALPLILAAIALSAAAAKAQTMPWPGERPGQPGAAAGPAPMAAPPPMMQMAPPPSMQQPDGEAQKCVAQFTELRNNVEKLGQATKAASDHKATREEMCKVIGVFAAAEEKWLQFTAANATKCRIPPEIPKQLKAVHARTMTARKNVCATGPEAPGAAGAGPSLSDALGTARLPVPDTSQSGRGTLDTLTGNAIAR